MTVSDIIKLPLRFDEKQLQREVGALLAQEWKAHFNHTNYAGDWSVIPLRSEGGNAGNIFSDPHAKQAFASTPLMQACPYIRQIMEEMVFEKQTVRLMRLGAGGQIKAHKDLALDYAEGYFRLHIPILTNPEVIFYLNDQPVHMQEGECWYLNFNEKHSVINSGNTDRIHLVIDGQVNAWTDQLFAAFQEEKKAPQMPTEDMEKMFAELQRINTPTSLKMAEEIKVQLEARN
jgi:hypothetical protein